MPCKFNIDLQTNAKIVAVDITVSADSMQRAIDAVAKFAYKATGWLDKWPGKMAYNLMPPTTCLSDVYTTPRRHGATYKQKRESHYDTLATVLNLSLKPKYC